MGGRQRLAAGNERCLSLALRTQRQPSLVWILAPSLSPGHHGHAATEQLMFECTVSHPGIRTLFSERVPNSAALYAVLNGHYKGEALVDDLQNPSQCVLRTNAILTFFGRQTKQHFLDQAIWQYVEKEPVWLVWPPDAELLPPLAQQAANIPRLGFSDYDPHSATLKAWRRRLPAGCQIRSIDRKLLARCLWREEMAFYGGSLDNFLAHGLGLCLVQGQEILVEAYASALGQTIAEIGAITHEPFRGRGLAPIVCAHLIAACEQRGYRAYWSCNADNMASIRVARKLGFRQESNYLILEYEPTGLYKG